jgi:hypothetical protein
MAEGIELNGNGPDIESLDFPVDPSTLPTTSELPLGDLLLEIKSVNVTKTKENTDGALNYKGELKVGGKKTVAVQFGVSEPAEFAGMPYTHRFYIGSDADPEAIKPGTWQRNGTLMMAMFKAAAVGGKTFKEYAAAAVGQVVGATVKVEVSKDPKYPDKHITRAFWTPGTRQVALVNVNADMDAVFSKPAPAPNFANND